VCAEVDQHTDKVQRSSGSRDAPSSDCSVCLSNTPTLLMSPLQLTFSPAHPACSGSSGRLCCGACLQATSSTWAARPRLRHTMR
jgi:hypothetical protein